MRRLTRFKSVTALLFFLLSSSFSCHISAQQTISLDGIWSFRIPEEVLLSGSDQERGASVEQLRPYIASSRQVQVPHTFNVMDGLETYSGKVCYSRILPIDPSMKGDRLRVHFNAVYHDAVVSVNGKKVGEHLNAGYTPFSFDITAYLDFSDGAENILTVECDNSYSALNFPYMRRFDWANDGGIIRSVSLHLSGEKSFRYIHVNPEINLADSTAKASFEIKLWEDAPRKADISLKITEKNSGRCIFETLQTLKKGAEGCYTLNADCGKVKLWHFDDPNLYSFEAKLLLKGEISDMKSEDFGFRKIELKGQTFTLNGEAVRLPGIENMPGSNPDFGMAESRDYMEKTVRMMKGLNCTISRYHWAQDDYRISLMDRMGMLVQEELAWWQSPDGKLTPEHLEVAKMQLSELIEAHYNHPGIFAWGLSNEVGHNGDDLCTLYDFVKKLDPNRLVDDLSNQLFETLGKDPCLKLDLPTWNEYMGTWHSKNKEDLIECMPKVRKALAGRPVLISENGLCEPAHTGGDARRVEEMIFHINEWKKQDFICGYIYFCLEDYRTQMGEEGIGRDAIRRHGVCDKRLNPKASYYVLQQTMTPVAITKVNRIYKGDNPQAEFEVRTNIAVKNDIPSYTIDGYSISYETLDGDLKSVSIPRLKPGENMDITLKDINKEFKFTVRRKDGSAVLTY